MGLEFHTGYLNAIIKQHHVFGMCQFLKDLPVRERYDKPISGEKCLSLFKSINSYKNDKDRCQIIFNSKDIVGISWVKTEDIITSVDKNVDFHHITRESSFKLMGSDYDKSIVLKHLLENHPDTTLWILWLLPLKLNIKEINKEIVYDQPFFIFSTDNMNLYKPYYVDLFE